MTRHLIHLALLTGLFVGANACEPAAPKPDEHHDEAEEAAGEAGHAGEVHLSAEAVERAEIRIGTIERRALGGGTAIPGEVQFDPISTAHVGPLVPGRFKKISVALGDRVERGQLLGLVASTDVSTARARLGQGRARLLAAEAALRRQQQLATEGIGAQRSLIEAEAQVGELRAEVTGLRSQLSVFGTGNSGELQLVAPIAGVVVEIHAIMGETATSEQPAFVITDPTKVWMQGRVPELEISRIQVGMRVMVRLHAYPDAALPGSITYVAPAVEERTRSLPVRVTLEVPDARLRSGLFGSIELIGGQADVRPLVVPVEAVATVDGQQVVFVPADEPNAFRPVAVQLGTRRGAFYELRAGLTEAAPVVLSGAFTLKSALKSSELSEGHAH